MRIGFNAQILSDASTGVARYAANMVKALVLLDTPHEFIVFGSPTIEQRSNVRVIPTASVVNSAVSRILWEQFVLPWKARQEGIDVLLFPDHTAPLFSKPCKVVITIHDLAFLAMPETFSAGRRLYKSLTIRRSVSQADCVITGSQSTAHECERLLGIAGHKITVVHYGAGSLRRVTDESELHRVRNRYGLRTPFILFLGTLERRKNVARLVDAFSELREDSSVQHQLVLAGGRGAGFEEISDAIKRSRFSGNIMHLGIVNEEDLAALYSLADLMVYPSLYEGFGFPVLEAMSCGCPVVASGSTSLPEVVGDAGVITSAVNVNGLCRAMRLLIYDDKARRKYVEAGYRRVAAFTWEQAAMRTLRAIEALTSSHTSSR